MTDASDYENCALLKLSEQPGLERFKHLILVSSYQDQFAPFDSARIQICADATKDVKLGNAYIKMAHNLLDKSDIQMVYRLDVNFHI